MLELMMLYCKFSTVRLIVRLCCASLSLSSVLNVVSLHTGADDNHRRAAQEVVVHRNNLDCRQATSHKTYNSNNNNKACQLIVGQVPTRRV